MATGNGMASVVNKTLIKDEELSVPQEIFDLKTILNKVETANVSEPEIPTKSSTEILSELFGSFNAEPPKILECVEQISDNRHDVAEQETSVRYKKNKKSKKKHKHKEKKHKKKTKSSKKQGSSEDSDDTSSGGQKHKNPSERKKKKKKKVKDSVSEPKLMPAMEPVSIKITTDGNQNVKRTVECLSAEPGSDPPRDSSVSVKSEEPPDNQAAGSQVESKAVDGMPPAATHPKQVTAGESLTPYRMQRSAHLN
jgi:hypothetical protein